MEDDRLLLVRELAVGGVKVQVVVIGDSFEHAGEVLGVAAAPGRDGTLVDRQVRVGDDQLGVDLEGGAQAVASLASSVGGVEGEVARRRLAEAGSALRAGEVLAEGEQFVVALALGGHELHLGHPVGQLESSLQRVGESPLDPVASDQAVDDDLDLVLLVPGQPLVALQELNDVEHFTVDAGSNEALRRQVLQQGVVLALAAAHHRSQHLESGAVGQ